ncbi:MAG: tetratricopeptide repeat protein, partial [Deltaproteobacteria bacterium]|nr:tetratricopeptide repeat protein [Deltaproteobacteria bacterium]
DLAEGRRTEARATLAALAAEPTASSGALAALARVHYADRRLAEAEALFERLAERTPKSAEVQAWLGLVKAERGQPDAAREAFRKAAAAGPSAMLGERLKRVIGPDTRP